MQVYLSEKCIKKKLDKERGNKKLLLLLKETLKHLAFTKNWQKQIIFYNIYGLQKVW